jgi:hypothetical protein
MSEQRSDWPALHAFVVAKLHELHESGSLLPESSDMEIRLAIGAIAYEIAQHAYELIAQSRDERHDRGRVQLEPAEGAE